MTDTPTFYGVVTDAGVFELHPLEKVKFRAYAKRFKGVECEITFRRRRTKRSDKQNRAYHRLLSEWALSEGHNIEDLKDDCLGAVFGYREVVSPITGEVRQVLAEPHTSTLDTVRFALLMERSVELAAGCGVILELPDEWKARTQAEQQKAERAARRKAAA
jgi:hypothetical protein